MMMLLMYHITMFHVGLGFMSLNKENSIRSLHPICLWWIYSNLILRFPTFLPSAYLSGMSPWSSPLVRCNSLIPTHIVLAMTRNFMPPTFPTLWPPPPKILVCHAKEFAVWFSSTYRECNIKNLTPHRLIVCSSQFDITRLIWDLWLWFRVNVAIIHNRKQRFEPPLPRFSLPIGGRCCEHSPRDLWRWMMRVFLWGSKAKRKASSTDSRYYFSCMYHLERDTVPSRPHQQGI